MKKNYQKPAMRIVTVQHHQMLCASVDGVNSSGTGIGFGGGSHGSAKSPSFGDWDDWDE